MGEMAKRNSFAIFKNKIKTYFMKPQNIILLLFGIVLTFTTIAPIVAIVQDTLKIHPGTIDQHLSGKASGYSLVNYTDLFTSKLAKTNLWIPIWNTVLLAVFTCLISILFGGLFAFLITRTNLKFKKYLSSIFIFPYIMPQWTLAVVWQNMFNSNAVTGTSNGLLASLFGIVMPKWWCQGLLPCAVVLGLHYAPFAYIMIGGIFRNMDANLEEAATILDTPKWRIMTRVTLPMVKPAILSTILLVFGSAMGSYPVPHYLGLTTLSTKYVSMNSKYTGEASILAIIMMIFGILILGINQMGLKSRKSYTTVTGKSGQISKINLGKACDRCDPDRCNLLYQYFPDRILCDRDFPSKSRRLQLPVHRRSEQPDDQVVDHQRKQRRRIVWTAGNPFQQYDLESSGRNYAGSGLLCTPCRYDRNPDRICGIQEPQKQVGELCKQHGIPALPDAVPGSWRSVLYPVFQ